MTFSDFLVNIKLIFTSIFNWLINISSALLNNFVFKIILFLIILVFLINLIIKIYNKFNNNDIDELDNIIDEDIEEEYWDDYEEGDFE